MFVCGILQIMSTPIIHKIFTEYGQNQVVVNFLGLQKGNGTRVKKQKYAPSTWIDNLLKLTQGKYTKQDFLNEIDKYKTDSIPDVNSSQVAKFLKDNGKSPTSVGKVPTKRAV